MCNHKTAPLIGGSKVYLLSIIDEVFAFGLKLNLNIIEVNRKYKNGYVLNQSSMQAVQQPITRHSFA